VESLLQPWISLAGLSVIRPVFSAAVQSKRAVNVRIATVTAGIRGTDLWGSSDAERDLVCLIEGRITVTHPQAEPVAMSEPLSFYVVPKGQAPKPVSAVIPRNVKVGAGTEMRPGGAGFSRTGRGNFPWGTVGSEAEALAFYDRIRAAGYPVRIRPQAVGDGAYHYALLVPQLVTRADAEALSVRLRLDLGLEGTQVTR
jgi:hypothetical protein